MVGCFPALASANQEAVRPPGPPYTQPGRITSPRTPDACSTSSSCAGRHATRLMGFRGAVSSTMWSPVSPCTQTPLVRMRVFGFAPRRPASIRVSIAFLSLATPFAEYSKAAWTSTAHSAATSAYVLGSARSPTTGSISCCSSQRAFASLRVRPQTRCPARRNAVATLDPTYPVAPVTNTCIGNSPVAEGCVPDNGVPGCPVSVRWNPRSRPVPGRAGRGRDPRPRSARTGPAPDPRGGRCPRTSSARWRGACRRSDRPTRRRRIAVAARPAGPGSRGRAAPPACPSGRGECDEEIRVEGVRRDRDHTALHRMAQDAAPVVRVHAPSHHRLVVHAFGGDIHQRELVGPLVRPDVFVGDLVDPVLERARERPPLALLLPTRGREHALARLEREFRVHGDEALAQPEDGVHALARAELVLHLVVAGEDLAQQLLQPHLADRAAQPRDLEQLLHLAHGLPHRLEPPRHLAELSHALAHVLQHARLLGAPLRQRLRHLVLCGDELVESGAQLDRSEEHTSELQSRLHLVCRLLLEKKKKNEQKIHQL